MWFGRLSTHGGAPGELRLLQSLALGEAAIELVTVTETAKLHKPFKYDAVAHE